MRPVIGITCTRIDSGKSSSHGINVDYINAIESAGGTPILLPLIQDNSCIADFVDLIDGLLLSGGVDVDPSFYGEELDPGIGKIDFDRDRTEISLSQKSLETDLPIFGICRGIQLLNVAAGGTLHQHIPGISNSILKHRQDAPGSHGTHTIDIREGSRLLNIIGHSAISVNSFHHQAVKEAAPGFLVSAAARDGIIEGIESTQHSFAIGAQFHPERMWQNNPPMNALFVAFVDAAERYSQQQKTMSEN